MGKGAMSVCIVDDEEAYFHPAMLKAAKNSGFGNIERRASVDASLFDDFLRNPRDIVILDVKGVTDSTVAKDGLDLARALFKRTRSYVVVTSAHQYHFSELHGQFDYMIPERLLTIVDFVDQLQTIVNDCLDRKKRFYQKGLLRIGLKIMKFAVLHGHNS